MCFLPLIFILLKRVWGIVKEVSLMECHYEN